MIMLNSSDDDQETSWKFKMRFKTTTTTNNTLVCLRRLAALLLLCTVLLHLISQSPQISGQQVVVWPPLPSSDIYPDQEQAAVSSQHEHRQHRRSPIEDGLASNHRHHTIWDFNSGRSGSISGSSGGGTWLAPRFAIEPPALVEYSNSTGTVIACRPQTMLAAQSLLSLGLEQPTTGSQKGGGQAAAEQQRRQLLLTNAAAATTTTATISTTTTPTSISWRVVRQLPTFDTTTGEHLTQQLDEELTGHSGLRQVRQDGSLVLAPFKATDYRREVHAAAYRCCLGNRFGSLCSRPVRTRAVIDSTFNVEVFDEFVLAGNSVALKCQTPTYLARYLEFAAWLRDDKIIATAQHQEHADKMGASYKVATRRPFKSDTIGSFAAQVDSSGAGQQQTTKYLMFQTGELYIRNATKSDSASYKCRVRNKLTGAIVTSKISAQLMVDESRSKSELRPTTAVGAEPTIMWTRENADIYLCSHVQSFPVAKFTWYKEFFTPNSNQRVDRQPISQDADPESIKQIDSCLFVQQAQQRHAGNYICEANNGDSVQRSTTRLIVTSAQLSAQLQLVQPQQQQQTGQVSNRMAVLAPQSPGGSQHQQQQAQIVHFGSTVYLNCSISGYPYDTIAWYKDAKLLTVSPIGNKKNSSKVSSTISSQNHPTLLNNVKLVQPTVISIENFSLKDRGVYQCQVYSAVAQAATTNISQIIAAAVASSHLLAGGDDYTATSFSTSTTNNQAQNNLVESLAERDYLRSASSSMQLDIAFSKPTLTQKFQSQTVQRGSPLSLQCTASGLPTPRILWLLDGLPISVVSEQSSSPLLDKSPLYTATYDADLNYKPLEWSDIVEQTNQLDMIDPHIVDEVLRNSHNLHNSNNNQETIGERFQVSSYMTTNYLAQPMIVSQLNISQLSVTETGQYKCLAVNSLGSTQHIAQINVLGGLELRSYQPTNVTLIAGRSSILQCPLIGYPLQRVDWFRDDQRLPINHRQRVEPIKQGSGGQLELVNVDKMADGGVYTCRATMQPPANGSFEATAVAGAAIVDDYDDLVGQVVANVRVAPLIDPQSLPEIVQANEGMRTKLVCSVVQGDHPVEIRWLKRVSDKNKLALVGRTHLAGFELMQNSNSNNGGRDDQISPSTTSQLEDSITIHNLEDSCLLTFKQISYTDSGDYVCLAQNDVSQTMRLTRVIVNVAPSWSLEPLSDISVLLGTRLHLDCSAHGFPQPSVVWKRESGGSGQVSRREPAFWQQQEESRGNPGGGGGQTSSSSSSDLSASSAALPLEYFDIVSNYRQRVYINGSLIIDQVDQTDAGTLMCEVANGIGTGLSKVVRVRVNVPPYFKHRASTHLSQLGGKAELKCLVYGDQPMVVGWRKDSDIVDLVNDSRHRLVNEHKIGAQAFESILTIDNLARNDSGQYFCIASNEYGTEDMRIQLIVQEPPEAPNLMRPIRAGARQATLSFRTPYSGNSPIRKYAILFKQMLTPSDTIDQQQLINLNQSTSSLGKDHLLNNWQQILLDAPLQSSAGIAESQLSSNTFSASTKNNDSSLLSSSSVHNEPTMNNQLVNLNLCCLQPFTRYLVRVRAINEIGQSEPSKATQFLSDEEAIGGPPLDVGVEATGAHSLKVRWRPPARHLQNGLIRGYYIGYRANPPSSQTNPLAQHAGDMKAVQQRGAATSISSNIKVFEGSSGDGEQYQYKNVQLEMSPLNFPVLGQEDQAAMLSILQQGATSNGTNSMSPQVFTSYLTNLRKKTAYSIIVQAYNKIGAGPRSDQIIVSTLDAAPPMSPILRLVSVSYNSAQLMWSGRRFNQNGSQSTNNNSNSKVSHRVFALNDESPGADEEEDDDPQSYYTINFRTEDFRISNPSSPSSNNDNEWQQRRIQKRQQMPYVLNNLRCGSYHSAFMTTTNSLGQSEPGDTIKFTTMGAAPLAPPSSREFLQVNSTYVVLRLSAWQNAGCIISTFILKYKASNQVKWTILEHQVHPTIQTVTISGAAVFSTRPLANDGGADQQPVVVADGSPSDGDNLLGLGKRAHPQQLHLMNKQQNLNDFIIRNLAISTTYKLIVEATSEAGSTVAEYELETANFSTSTIAVNVNGVAASDLIAINSGGHRSMVGGKGGRASLDSSSSDSGDLDFSYSGGQRGSSPFQRYNLGVWSLTVLFVVASIFMATTTLVLGFRSIMRLKPMPANPRDTLISAMFCCSARSSSASSSGADSSSGGTCYQMPDHPMDAYCSLPAGHQLMLSANEATPTRAHATATTISGHIDTCDGGELKSIMGAGVDSLPFRQLVSSSSLSTIGGGRHFNTNNARHTNTLGGVAHCQSSGRRFSGDNETAAQNHIRAHYAATLGKQHSTFTQSPQPIKYNHHSVSPLYGRLTNQNNNKSTMQVGDAQQQQHYAGHNNNNSAPTNYQVFHPHPISSSGTSGYETSNSIKIGSSPDTGADCQVAQPVYLQSMDAYNQMNHIYGANGINVANDLFGGSNNNNQEYEHDAILDMNRDQGQFHYNQVSTGAVKAINCQQQQSLDNVAEHMASSGAYGVIFGGEQQSATLNIQHSSRPDRLNHNNNNNNNNHQQQLEPQELSHLQTFMANHQQQQ